MHKLISQMIVILIETRLNYKMRVIMTIIKIKIMLQIASMAIKMLITIILNKAMSPTAPTEISIIQIASMKIKILQTE